MQLAIFPFWAVFLFNYAPRRAHKDTIKKSVCWISQQSIGGVIDEQYIKHNYSLWKVLQTNGVPDRKRIQWRTISSML